MTANVVANVWKVTSSPDASPAVNLTGAFRCAQEAVRRMSTANGGSGGAIVNVSSRAPSFGSPDEFIDTDLHTDAGMPGRVTALAANVPMQRGGTAIEVANLITWLLSADASYMTGALVDVGGGR